MLVFNNIEEYYFLLLLGCAKFELYDFLNDNNLESDSDRLNELLNDSKDALTCCIQMFDKPLEDELKNLIKGFFFTFCVSLILYSLIKIFKYKQFFKLNVRIQLS